MNIEKNKSEESPKGVCWQSDSFCTLGILIFSGFVINRRQAEGHGYGLANIRRVAGKYSGGMAIDVKDGEFRISIMLMMDSE